LGCTRHRTAGSGDRDRKTEVGSDVENIPGSQLKGGLEYEVRPEAPHVGLGSLLAQFGELSCRDDVHRCEVDEPSAQVRPGDVLHIDVAGDAR
jgi:hypothetical protein